MQHPIILILVDVCLIGILTPVALIYVGLPDFSDPNEVSNNYRIFEDKYRVVFPKAVCKTVVTKIGVATNGSIPSRPTDSGFAHFEKRCANLIQKKRSILHCL